LSWAKFVISGLSQLCVFQGKSSWSPSDHTKAILNQICEAIASSPKSIVVLRVRSFVLPLTRLSKMSLIRLPPRPTKGVALFHRNMSALSVNKLAGCVTLPRHLQLVITANTSAVTSAALNARHIETHDRIFSKL
jgi:hypothetical protein